MATPNERTDERNKKLDRLQEALDDWYGVEEKRLKDEATYLRSVLKGRTGSERLSKANTKEAEVLVTTSINAFLAGDT